MLCATITRALALALSLTTGIADAAQRPFTVADSIGMSSFLSPQKYLPAPGATFSPDGSYFVVATMRGDVQSGKREATLWLFSSDAVRDAAEGKNASAAKKPRQWVRISSAANRDPLSEWRWSSDSKSLLFLGADDDGAARLYRVALDSTTPVALSRADQDVSRFDEYNGAVVYLAHAPIRAGDVYQGGGDSLPDIEVATGKNLLPLVFPNWMDMEFHTSEDELWYVQGDRAAAVTTGDGKTPIRLKDSRLTVSADGKQAIVTPFVKHIPQSWERYQPLMDYPGLRLVADTPATENTTGMYRPKYFATVDLVSGRVSTLLDAPIESNSLIYNRVVARWNADGTRIALASIYPSLASDGKTTPAATPVLPCEVAIFTVATRAFACARTLAPIDASKTPYRMRRQMIGLDWAADGRAGSVVVARYVTPNRPDAVLETRFSESNGVWTANDVAADAAGLAVEVQEGLNQPPVLVARVGSGVPHPLLDPNPQLYDIALGNAVLYHWKDADGSAWDGALVTPPGFSKARRYPLVVQTHGLDENRFLVDGPSATGFAARALAARGIVVLQVREINKNSATPKESKTGAAGYRAAITQLANEGIIDPKKVGIITWSHYGPYALQGLIDDSPRYAAATFAEASFNSYSEYLVNVDYMGGTSREQMFRAQFGAKPFGEGLKKALENSGGFHTDRVCTPVLYQINSPIALMYSWDAYAALRVQNKPVDLLYIRNGEHVLVKPKQRLVEQGMNVDWYDYWLNGHKDSDQAKRAQYQRWDLLRAQPRCGDEGEIPSPAK